MCPEKPPPRWLSAKSTKQDDAYHTTCGGVGGVCACTHMCLHSAKLCQAAAWYGNCSKSRGPSGKHNTDPLLSWECILLGEWQAVSRWGGWPPGGKWCRKKRRDMRDAGDRLELYQEEGIWAKIPTMRERESEDGVGAFQPGGRREGSLTVQAGGSCQLEGERGEEAQKGSQKSLLVVQRILVSYWEEMWRDLTSGFKSAQRKIPQGMHTHTHTHTHRSHSVMSDSLWPPWIVAHQAPRSMGFSRHEYWSGLPLQDRKSVV